MTTIRRTQPSPKFILLIAAIFIGLFLISVLSSRLFVTIDSGEQGVIFKRFGGGVDTENILDQGFHVVAPWNKVFKYNVRVQESFESMSVLSKNGLNIDVELTYRYKPVSKDLGFLHDNIGPDYHESIIIPEVRSSTREVIGKYLPEELYSTKREVIQDEIFNMTKEAVQKKFIELDAILIRGVVLPKTLQDAIERKLKEEQSSLEYEYRLEKERKESERKIIEARAKAEANKILSASLTDKILREKGIEATLELSKSPNSKIIVVGGEDGLPIILGNN